MEKGETSAGSAASLHRPLCGLLTGILILSGLSAGAALAAPCSDVLCDNVTHALRGLEANADHAKNTPSAVSAVRTESSAPLLYLTPRVTSILEDVFGGDVVGHVFDNSRASGNPAPDIADRAADAARLAPANGKTHLPKSPVAGTDGTANAPGRYIPLPSALGDASLLPKLQRQMYRTDI